MRINTTSVSLISRRLTEEYYQFKANWFVSQVISLFQKKQLGVELLYAKAKLA